MFASGTLLNMRRVLPGTLPIARKPAWEFFNFEGGLERKKEACICLPQAPC